MLYVGIDLAFGLVGLLVGRFAIVALPVLVWAFWGIGEERHWWGNGGEQILLGTVILIVIGVAAAGVGVLANRLLLRSRISGGR